MVKYHAFFSAKYIILKNEKPNHDYSSLRSEISRLWIKYKKEKYTKYRPQVIDSEDED